MPAVVVSVELAAASDHSVATAAVAAARMRGWAGGGRHE